MKSAVEDAKYDWEKKGCFAVNTIVEAIGDQQINQLIEQRHNLLVQKLTKVVIEGKEEGSFNLNLTPEKIASLILNHSLGLRMMSRTSISNNQLNNAVEGLTEVLTAT